MEWQLSYLSGARRRAMKLEACRPDNRSDRYEKRLKKEYRLYKDWLVFVGQFSTEEQMLLVMHFEKNLKLSDPVLGALLSLVEDPLESYEEAEEARRDTQAMMEFKASRPHTRKPESRVVNMSSMHFGEYEKRPNTSTEMQALDNIARERII